MRMLTLALVLFGCSPAVPTPQQQAAVGEYEIELQVCVAQSVSRAQADACMCEVSKRFDRADAGLCK